MRPPLDSAPRPPKYACVSLPPAYLRQKLTQPLPTKDGAVLRTIGEAANYMLALPHRAGHRLVIPASTAPGLSKRDKDRAKPIKHIGNGGSYVERMLSDTEAIILASIILAAATIGVAWLPLM
jgi:hypothetical protein